MSKKVTIPTDGGNPFVVILGGVKYVYKPGETVDVPDGVALEIEEWKRWKNKYHGAVQPPFAAGDDGSAVQPDLSQNDPAAADYVKNRTHYEETKNVVIAEDPQARNIMPHIKSTVEGYSTNGYLRGDAIIPGETYVVNFDGVDYVGVAYEGSSIVCIFGGGDGKSDYTKAPFNILVLPENEVMLMTTDGKQHQLKIVHVQKHIKKLDKKYLPDSIPYEENTVVNEPLNITWDGNTEGLVSVTLGSATYYHVSAIVLSDDHIRMATVADTMGDIVALDDQWNDPENSPTVTEDVVAFHGSICFARKDNAAYSDEFVTTTFPKAGIYFAAIPNFVHINSLTTTEPVEQTKTVVKKLDKKFLPDDVGGGSIMYCGGNNDDDDVHLFHFDFDTGEIGAAVTRAELVAAFKHGAIYIALIDEYSVSYKLATFVYFGNNDGYIGTSDEEYFHTAEFEQSSGPV